MSRALRKPSPRAISAAGSAAGRRWRRAAEGPKGRAIPLAAVPTDVLPDWQVRTEAVPGLAWPAVRRAWRPRARLATERCPAPVRLRLAEIRGPARMTVRRRAAA